MLLLAVLSLSVYCEVDNEYSEDDVYSIQHRERREVASKGDSADLLVRVKRGKVYLAMTS